MEQFCLAPGLSRLEPGELLVSLHLPPPEPRSGSSYLRFIPRNEMDIAVVGAKAWIVLGEGGTQIADARVAWRPSPPRPST